MKNKMKEEFYETINEFKRIIKINKNKIPDYYLDRDFFSTTIDNLDKNIYNTDLLHIEYIDFLMNFGKLLMSMTLILARLKNQYLIKLKNIVDLMDHKEKQFLVSEKIIFIKMN